jgi:hypothetical protein
MRTLDKRNQSQATKAKICLKQQKSAKAKDLLIQMVNTSGKTKEKPNR